MNNQFIQGVTFDWDRIDNDSYLKRIEAFLGVKKLVKELTKKMNQAAAELNFEEAVVLRDRMVEVKKMLLDLENS